jgi:hypothetical protein
MAEAMDTAVAATTADVAATVMADVPDTAA